MDDAYLKYRKMLKAGLPMGAVLNAMQRDGVDPKGFDENTSGSDNDLGGSQGSGDPSEIPGPYQKYHKMLKMGLPKGAVEQAMLRDGVDPKGIDKPTPAPNTTIANDPVSSTAAPATPSAPAKGFLADISKGKSLKKTQTNDRSSAVKSGVSSNTSGVSSAGPSTPQFQPPPKPSGMLGELSAKLALKANSGPIHIPEKKETSVNSGSRSVSPSKTSTPPTPIKKPAAPTQVKVSPPVVTPVVVDNKPSSTPEIGFKSNVTNSISNLTSSISAKIGGAFQAADSASSHDETPKPISQVKTDNNIGVSLTSKVGASVSSLLGETSALMSSIATRSPAGESKTTSIPVQSPVINKTQEDIKNEPGSVTMIPSDVKPLSSSIAKETLKEEPKITENDIGDYFGNMVSKASPAPISTKRDESPAPKKIEETTTTKRDESPAKMASSTPKKEETNAVSSLLGEASAMMNSMTQRVTTTKRDESPAPKKTEETTATKRDESPLKPASSISKQNDVLVSSSTGSAKPVKVASVLNPAPKMLESVLTSSASTTNTTASTSSSLPDAQAVYAAMRSKKPAWQLGEELAKEKQKEVQERLKRHGSSSAGDSIKAVNVKPTPSSVATTTGSPSRKVELDESTTASKLSRVEPTNTNNRSLSPTKPVVVAAKPAVTPVQTTNPSNASTDAKSVYAAMRSKKPAWQVAEELAAQKKKT